VFSDNGETGTNFNRPGFTAMMDEVRAGKIDCIVVKDLSRFGRNYIETGEYLEKIFPFMGVRFIAINDGYDSENENNTDVLVVNLKNLINDFYAKDISKKIASSFRTMQENGDFIGCYAPYGYKKSDENRRKLIIDEETAPIVRTIFRWRANGLGTTTIAKRLNNIGIPSPIERHLKSGKIKKTGRVKWHVWNSSAVKIIAENQMYLGHMVQGKKRQDLHEIKYIPSSEWIIVKNTHEPIIEQELFDKAQITRNIPKKKCAVRTKYDPNEDYLFKDLLICPNCGLVLKRLNRSKYTRFYCPLRQAKTKKACNHKSVREVYLIEVVSRLLKVKIEEAGGLPAIIKRHDCSGEIETRKSEALKQLGQQKREIKRLTQLKVSLYESYADKLLTEDEYIYSKNQYTEQIDSAKKTLDRLQSESETVQESLPKIKWLKSLTQFAVSGELSSDIVHALIDRIIVNGEECMEIVWNFKDEYQAFSEFTNPVRKEDS